MEAKVELEVGLAHAALHVIKSHCMESVGVRFGLVAYYAVEACGFFLRRSRNGFCPVRGSFKRLKVNGAGRSGMRAAEVENELTVDIYPEVVVTREVKGLRKSVRCTVNRAVSVNGEGDFKLHTKAHIVS